MTRKVTAVSLSALFNYGRKCLSAQRHPGDHYPFRPFACSVCGVKPLTLNIEHHTGSAKNDFKGVVDGRCSACGTETRVFSFTGEHRRPEREERPVCTCGSTDFLAGVVEHIEGDEGLPGFFDEGVIVAQCAACGRVTALLYID